MADFTFLGELGQTLFTIPGWNGGTVDDLDNYLRSLGVTTDRDKSWFYRTGQDAGYWINTAFYDENGNELDTDEVINRLSTGNKDIYVTPQHGRFLANTRKKIRGMLSAFGLKVKEGGEWLIDNLIENMGYDKERGTWVDITKIGDKAVTTATKTDFDKLKGLLKKNNIVGNDTSTSLVSGNWSLPLEIKHVAAYQNQVAIDLLTETASYLKAAGYTISDTTITKIALGQIVEERLTEDELTEEERKHLGLFSVSIESYGSASNADDRLAFRAVYCTNNLDADYNISASEDGYILAGTYLIEKKDYAVGPISTSAENGKMFYASGGINKGEIETDYAVLENAYEPYRPVWQNAITGGKYRSDVDYAEPILDKENKITEYVLTINGEKKLWNEFNGIIAFSASGNEYHSLYGEHLYPNFGALGTASVAFIVGDAVNISEDSEYYATFYNIYENIIGMDYTSAIVYSLSRGDDSHYERSTKEDPRNTVTPRAGFAYGTIHTTGIQNGININFEKTDDNAQVVDPDKTLEEQYEGWVSNGKAIVETYPRDDTLTQDKGIALPFPVAEDATQEVAQDGTKVWDYTKAAEDAIGAAAVDKAAEIDAATKIDAALVNPTINPVIPGGKVDITTPSGVGSGGLWAIYNPTVAQIQNFGKWLWEDPVEGLTQPGDTLKKLFQNPMDAIISLHKIYVTPTTGGSQNIKVGYLDSGVSSNIVTNRYVTKSLGTVKITPLNANFMDFDGVELTIFLPFIGMRSLDTSICMGATLSLTYRVDILTGAIVASLTVQKNNISGVVYQWVGNMLESVPLTSSNFSQAVNAIIGLVGSAVTTIATGGATAPMIAGAGINALGRAGTSIQNCGSIGGNAGALASKTPYIVYSIVQTYNPYNWQKIKGIPDNVTQTVGKQAGYIEADEITGNTTMTDEEFRECEQVFATGVFIN